MSDDRKCAECGQPLPDDSPSVNVCKSCGEALALDAEREMGDYRNQWENEP